MRDGQQLSLNDTYQLMQIVTDGRLSAYSNVLIIKAAASDIIGHTYSCTVINAFGTISKALMACTYSGAWLHGSNLADVYSYYCYIDSYSHACIQRYSYLGVMTAIPFLSPSSHCHNLTI